MNNNIHEAAEEMDKIVKKYPNNSKLQTAWNKFKTLIKKPELTTDSSG